MFPSRRQKVPSPSADRVSTAHRRRPWLAGLAALSLFGVAAPAPAQTASEPRLATRLSPQFAQSARTAVTSLIDSLKAHRPEAAAAPKAPKLSYPYGTGVDGNGDIYVTNLSGGVNEYGPGLAYWNTITAGVSYPAAVGVNSTGDIYIANNGANNITIYNPKHAQIGTISDASLQSPTSLYVDPEDTIWVPDGGGNLHSYLYNATALPATHTGGAVVGPWGPNVTVWGIANNAGTYDEVYENRAEADHGGAVLYNIYIGGFPYFSGETQDRFFQQYVAVSHNQIQIWSADGVSDVGAINTPSAPYGVAVDPVRNRLYVVLTAINQVNVYSTVAPYKLLGQIN